MYVVAEEDNEERAGGIVILSSNWLTPKKAESFWPAVKNQTIFNKLLKNHENPGEDWTLIKIKKKFYECDDLLVARKKSRDAELYSDLTDGEIGGPRKRYKPNRVESSSSGDEDVFNQHKNGKLARKTIFENPGPCEMNASFNEGSPRFASSQTLSPARLPAEKSGTSCEKNPVIGSPSSNLPAIVSSSTTLSTAKTAYEYNVMQLLTTIKEQNTVILEWIRKQNAKESHFKKTDLQLPVEFPLNNEEQLQQMESFLASNQNFTDLCEYFGEFAGPTVTGTVNAILKHTLTNHLAATYSFRGKKGKRAFEDLTLKTAIVRAVKKICNIVRDQPIEDDMKVWLKHAPQRIILQDKKIRARLDRIA